MSNIYEPDFAVHPGETISEYIESSGMSRTEFAKRLGMSIQNLSRILNGKFAVSPETANALERVTGVTSTFWLKLQALYDAYETKCNIKKEAEANIKWIKKFKYAELAKRGWVKMTRKLSERYQQLLDFFGVASPRSWYNLWLEPDAAPRRSPAFASNSYLASIWLRMGEKKVLRDNFNIETNRESLKRLIPQLRELTRLSQEEFIPKLKSLCQSAGVAVVLTPSISGLSWVGATKWLNGKTAIIMLSDRGKYEGIFWFSFFHEVCHVLKDGKKDILGNDRKKEDAREKRADDFAAKVLYQGEEKRIISAQSESDIINISNDLGVSPGIIAGALQHLTNDHTKFKYLCHKISFKEDDLAREASCPLTTANSRRGAVDLE